MVNRGRQRCLEGGPGPTGLWEGTGSRCSGLLLAVDLGLRQGLQKKHSGAPP